MDENWTIVGRWLDENSMEKWRNIGRSLGWNSLAGNGHSRGLFILRVFSFVCSGVFSSSARSAIQYTVSHSVYSQPFSIQSAIQYTVSHSVYSQPFSIQSAIQLFTFRTPFSGARPHHQAHQNPKTLNP
jgi:hypothetical protein